MSKREQVAEVEVVSENDEAMFPCPRQDLAVFGFGITNRRPVSGLKSMDLKELPPLGGKPPYR